MAETNKAASVDADSQNSENAILLAKLRAAEETIERLKLEQEEAQRREAGLKIRPGELPLKVADGSYEFEVGPMLDKDKDKCPTVTVNCVDESEAIRWYCASHEYPPGSRKQVDPIHIKLRATCKDSRRNQLINLKKQIAAIRVKVESGQSLSKNENEMFNKYQDAVLNLQSVG